MAGSRGIKDKNIQTVMYNIQHLCYEIAGIKRHSLTGLQIYLNMIGSTNIFHQINQRFHIIITVRNMMPAAQIQPFKLLKVLAELRFERLPCRQQVIRVLLTQRMEMQAFDFRRQILRKVRQRYA